MLIYVFNKYYKSVRGVESGLDSRLPSRAVLHFVTGKFLEKVRSTVRGRPHAFQGAGVKIVGRRQLVVGRNVVLGSGAKINAVSVQGIELGDAVTLDDQAILRSSGVLRNLGVGIKVGSSTAIGVSNFIHGGGGVTIGANCLLGPFVSIFSENHNFESASVPIRHQGETRLAVEIEDDVWIGAGSTVLAGVTIGRGSVVAAGSVVTKNVSPYTVVGGIPARIISIRSGGVNHEV